MTRFSRVCEKKVTVHNHESNMIAKKRPIHTLSNLDRKRPWKRKWEKPRGEKSILCLRLYHIMIGGKRKRLRALAVSRAVFTMSFPKVSF